jgi:hypothetical protein
MFLQRLIMFTREKCPDKINQLKERVDAWKKEGPFTVLSKYKSIGLQLGEFYLGATETDELERIIALDMDAICVRLFLMLKEPVRYKKLLELQGERAQGLLDLFQTVRTTPCLSDRARIDTCRNIASGSPCLGSYLQEFFLERFASFFQQVRPLSGYPFTAKCLPGRG